MADRSKRNGVQAPDPRRLQTRLALIGAGAALTGALMGGATTLFVTIRSEDQQRVEDRRDERREAYSAFYGEAAATASDLTLRADLIFSETGGSEAEDREEIDDLRTVLDDRARELAHQQALLVLLGPEEVSAAGFELISALTQFRQQISAELLDLDESYKRLDDVSAALSAFGDEAAKALNAEG